MKACRLSRLMLTIRCRRHRAGYFPASTSTAPIMKILPMDCVPDHRLLAHPYGGTEHSSRRSRSCREVDACPDRSSPCGACSTSMEKSEKRTAIFDGRARRSYRWQAGWNLGGDDQGASRRLHHLGRLRAQPNSNSRSIIMARAGGVKSGRGGKALLSGCRDSGLFWK